MSDYCFVRAFGIYTVTYTILYPHVVFPAVNITMTASIYMTVVLALERFVRLYVNKTNKMYTFNDMNIVLYKYIIYILT